MSGRGGTNKNNTLLSFKALTLSYAPNLNNLDRRLYWSVSQPFLLRCFDRPSAKACSHTANRFPMMDSYSIPITRTLSVPCTVCWAPHRVESSTLVSLCNPGWRPREGEWNLSGRRYDRARSLIIKMVSLWLKNSSYLLRRSIRCSPRPLTIIELWLCASFSWPRGEGCSPRSPERPRSLLELSKLPQLPGVLPHRRSVSVFGLSTNSREILDISIWYSLRNVFNLAFNRWF